MAKLGERISKDTRALMSVAAQERAYWTKIFTRVRQAADAGDRREAIRELDAYLRERQEKEVA
jgi:hypothetical protein